MNVFGEYVYDSNAIQHRCMTVAAVVVHPGDTANEPKLESHSS